MLDINRWAEWASQQTAALQELGFTSGFTFTEPSRNGENPAFFVDLDTDSAVGRIIFRATGDFDVSVHQDASDMAIPILDLPVKATDENFEAIFRRFVETVRG